MAEHHIGSTGSLIFYKLILYINLLSF